eukprot:TRINITY_DN4977_c0_g1_i1.p1 TRINITY_DN4977_c0_g1~~TRINITY_DN4977_c0_g1_i1.p1  ORF type:complete len:729 (-),score=121.13 TRINITY_DN4977_c0_g1_i1:921-3107(-)
MTDEDTIDLRAFEDYVDPEMSSSSPTAERHVPVILSATIQEPRGVRRCTLDFIKTSNDDLTQATDAFNEILLSSTSRDGASLSTSNQGLLGETIGGSKRKPRISSVFSTQEVDTMVAKKREENVVAAPVEHRVVQIHPAHLDSSETVKGAAMEYFGFENDIAPKWALNLWLTQNSATSPELPFQEILFAPDLLLATAISTTVPITEAEDIAKSLVRVFQSCGDTLRLLKFSIKREVAATESANTLFRSNSMSSKLLSHFSRMAGTQYLCHVLKPHLQIIYSKNIGIEIDPHKLKDKISIRDAQVKQLRTWCQAVFDSIIQSVGESPQSFRIICNHLQSEVGKRFPEKRVISVGSFIFLRYFCPAIVAPHAFGLMKKSPSEDVQRTLILISKVLQNLANCTDFGGKEEWMAPMNIFIQENQTRLHVYCNTMAAPVIDIQVVSDNQYPITKPVYEESMDRLVLSISKYREALSQKLERKKVTATISYKTLDRLQFSIPSLRKASGTTVTNSRARLTIVDIVNPEDFEPLSNIIDMLFCPTAKVLNALLTVLQQAVSLSDSARIITALMKLFQGNGQLLILLDILCGRDASRTGSVEGFLASSMTGNVIGDIYALESPKYLAHIIEPLVQEVMQSNHSFILDPSVDVEEAKKNSLEIQRLAGIFLNRLLTSEKECPMVLRHMFGIFQSYVTEYRLSPNKYEATARSFIVNLVCPAVAFPERHQLVSCLFSC